MFALLLAAVMVLALAACGSGSAAPASSAASAVEAPASAASSENAASEPSAEESNTGNGLANPWTDVETAEEAAEGAGVGYFQVMENGTETSGGQVSFSAFRFMEGLAEAVGGIGSAELTVRKGLKQDSTDVSGDYTEYACSWTQDVDVWQVTCYGNEDGKAMKAIWTSDNFSYSIMVRGQGDFYETYGVDADAVEALVLAIQ